MTSLKYHLAHAVGPVFMLKPHHPIDKCQYCRDSMSVVGKHIYEQVPLEYQNIKCATGIDRYSIVVDGGYQSEEGQQMHNFFENNMACDMNRFLAHYANKLPAAPNFIEQELDQLALYIKYHKHCFIYARDITLILPNFSVSTNIWIVSNGIVPDEFFIYSFDKVMNCLKLTKSSVKNEDQANIYWLVLSRVKEFLKIMEQYMYRRTIFNLLQALPPDTTFHTNKVLDIKKLYFGFG